MFAADWGAADLSQGGRRGRVGPEVVHAAAQNDGRVGPVPSDLADPLVLDVVERDGVGDFVAYEKNVGLLVQNGKKRFPSSLTTRPDKLEGLSLETLSSQVLEFEGKDRANPIGVPFRCFLLG